jgi:hypothetical protein
LDFLGCFGVCGYVSFHSDKAQRPHRNVTIHLILIRNLDLYPVIIAVDTLLLTNELW